MIEQIQRVIANFVERGGTQGAAKESLGTVPASYNAGVEAGGVMFDGMQLKDDFGETLKSYSPPKGE